MKIEVKNFNRKKLFEMYKNRTNPFSFVTTRIDITNIYKLCQKKKNYYATIGYFLTIALNEIDEFKYVYENGKFYKYDKINPSFTDIREDNTIGIYTCKLKENYEDFINEFVETKKKFLNNEENLFNITDGIIWLSCQPWFNFSSIIPPFDQKSTTPHMIWDKFILEDNRCYINLMIMAHHGFVDGYHIGNLINKINEIIKNICIDE